MCILYNGPPAIQCITLNVTIGRQITKYQKYLKRNTKSLCKSEAICIVVVVVGKFAGKSSDSPRPERVGFDDEVI